jgi:MFS transporter, DHA1 family, multidrug resistance protein
MYDIIRDSSFGQIVRFASGGRFLKYADERSGFQVPDRYILAPTIPSVDNSETSTVVEQIVTPGSKTSKNLQSLEPKLDGAATAFEHDDPYLIDWYSPDDPENPM